MSSYILGIDQSTQGTKALLFDSEGRLICRYDRSHQQLINEKGWVEHNALEIYENTLQVVKELVEKSGIHKSEILAVGISNQRETAVAWDRKNGKPVFNAIVWQCSRGEEICKRIEHQGGAQLIRSKTGLPISPYFSAAKWAWILENIEEAKELEENGELCCGTMDSFLIYQLTHGKEFKTDYSNASRTQMFDIKKLCWDQEICSLFGISETCLAEVTDSNGYYGMTDFDGFLDQPIPIRGVMGDSHGALFGQGCLNNGMIKATYGTGSSVMMNIGADPVLSNSVVTSLAWGMDGTVSYVLEGNINYTGAVITWMKDDLGIISSPDETGNLAMEANEKDRTYLVPAFSGLGAPYWDSNASASVVGMTRMTKKAEFVKAGLESIAFQITDVIKTMEKESEIQIQELRVDGGPVKNSYLMQFQSDMANIPVYVPKVEELSGIGAAYMAGIGTGLYEKESLFKKIDYQIYSPVMSETEQNDRYQGWLSAVNKVLTNLSDL